MTPPASLLDEIDFTDRETQVCPFQAYGRINAAGGVYFDRATGFYVVTDYDLVRELALNNTDLLNQTGILGVRNDEGQEEIDRIYRENGVPMRDVLVSSDPPDHYFQRSLVDKVFNPRRVASMEPYLRQVVDSAIDGFIEKGQADFHTELSINVPMIVIADQLGLPRTPADVARFKTWSDAMNDRSEPQVDHETAVRATYLLCELQRFVVQKGEEYRAQPQDCLLSDLVHAEADGRRLSLEELVSIVAIIIVAGNETTTTAISHGMIRLTTEPGLQDRLRADPGLIPQFVEEVLRIDAPLQGLFRRARVPMNIGGVQVPVDSIVELRWGGANHDPDQFQDPDKFDLDRSNSRQHVAFGLGPHFCVGHQLARTELRYVFEHVLRRMKNIKLAARPDAVVHRPHYVAFGLKELHITFDRTS